VNTRNASLNYARIPNEEIYPIVKAFCSKFFDFLLEKGFPKDLKFHTSAFDIVDMINRVDKRKAYYYCFHKEMKINECKVAALYAYWILKLRPFTITDERYKNKPEICNINEAFAIYVIGAALLLTERIKSTDKTKLSYYNLLEYSFRFRNFSIDSFIVLIESITTEALEREYPNLGYYNQL
jgi:hypothetical protein